MNTVQDTEQYLSTPWLLREHILILPIIDNRLYPSLPIYLQLREDEGRVTVTVRLCVSLK